MSLFCVLLLGEAMIAQTGSIQPMSASFRGAKNILIVSADAIRKPADAIRMSADTLIVFLRTNQRSQIPLTPPTGLTGPTSPISQATAACLRNNKKSRHLSMTTSYFVQSG